MTQTARIRKLIIVMLSFVFRSTSAPVATRAVWVIPGHDYGVAFDRIGRLPAAIVLNKLIRAASAAFAPPWERYSLIPNQSRPGLRNWACRTFDPLYCEEACGTRMAAA